MPPACPTCARANRGGASFCAQCGTALVRTCPGCGTSQPAGHAFCDGCGAALGSEDVTTPREAAPLDYTPRHLVEKILHQRGALEGERKQVTVLFVDIKGSLELSERTDPEQWHRILDGFFQILAEGVHRFEGTINQYTGDGIMALFGAPIAHEDHAQRACWAALHVLERLREYGQRLRLEQGVNFAVRVGINSGDVVVAAIGDDLRMDYTAQGHTVGLAARVEQIAEPGCAYLTGHTARLVEGFFELADLGTFSVKGADAVQVFELRGVGELRTRLDRSRARGLTRFVGRQRELARVREALARARDGHGVALGVVGEAGVGKSRLCAEVVGLARAEGCDVIEVHCPAHGRAFDLAPVRELVRGLLDVGEHEPPHEARRKVAGELLLHDEALGEALPLVLDLLGIAESDVPTGDPQSRRRRLHEVVAELLRRRAQRAPLLVVIDDLHWIDPGSESFLLPLAETLAAAPVLLLANFRPEYAPRWQQRFSGEPLALAPLVGDELAELMERLLGPDPSVKELPDRIRSQTSGNPLFVEELVQSLVESGALQGERGDYVLAHPIETLEVPSSVQAIVAGRIDRLPERDKRVLQCAAVIGKEFERALLDRVVELSVDEVDAALDALEQAEFISRRAGRADGDWQFRHPVTQEVAYASQLRDRRAGVHAELARVLIAADDESMTRAPLVAHHLEESGDLIEAGHWHLRAANVAQKRDYDAATRHLRRAVELGDRAGDDEPAHELGGAARTALLLLGGQQGIAKDEAERLLEEGRRCLAHLPAGGQRFMLLSGYGLSCIFAGDFPESLEIFEEADAIAREQGGRVLSLASKVSLAYAQLMLGRLGEALENLDPTLAELGANPDLDRAFSMGSPGSGSVLQLRASVRSRLGRLDAAEEDLDRAIAYARERDIPDWEALGLANRAELMVMRGEPDRAARDAERALRLGRRLAHLSSMLQAWSALGGAHAMWGRFDVARRTLEIALDNSRSSGNIAPETTITRQLAEVLVASGEPEEALAMARGAVTVASLRSAEVDEIDARLGLARVAFAIDGPNEETAQCLVRARLLIERRAARLYAPEVAEARARIAEARGDEAADALWREARDGYAAIGARGHAERLSARL